MLDTVVLGRGDIEPSSAGGEVLTYEAGERSGRR